MLKYLDILHTENGYNAPRNGCNMAQMFANQSKSMKSQFNQLNTKLMNDFESILTGNCVYIPHYCWGWALGQCVGSVVGASVLQFSRQLLV